MNVVMVATVHGLAGETAELERQLGGLRDVALSQPDCSAFDIGQVLGSSADYLIAATFADEAAVRAHYASTAYARFTREAGALLARPSDAVLHYVASTLHPRGDASEDPTRQG